MKKSTRLGLTGFLVAGVTTLGTVLTGAATAADVKEDQKAKVGEKAPDFTLETMDGESHTLSELTKDGKIVVLEWFAPDCPYVVKHYDDTQKSTVNNLVTEFKDKDVVFLAINSSATDHPFGNAERNKERYKNWQINHPLLIDAEGKVGKMYQARTTPHMYVIDKEGVLRYSGALDNDSSARGIGDVNYVRQALTEVLAGETVTVTETRPYGCGVKYAG